VSSTPGFGRLESLSWLTASYQTTSSLFSANSAFPPFDRSIHFLVRSRFSHSSLGLSRYSAANLGFGFGWLSNQNSKPGSSDVLPRQRRFSVGCCVQFGWSSSFGERLGIWPAAQSSFVFFPGSVDEIRDNTFDDYRRLVVLTIARGSCLRSWPWSAFRSYVGAQLIALPTNLEKLMSL
jgi:hypothetical protein